LFLFVCCLGDSWSNCFHVFLLNISVREREVVGAWTFHYRFHVEFWCCFHISSLTLRTNENLTWNDKGNWQAKDNVILRINLI
jgi:hypothetical protein